jgi:hypothetical protein
MHYHFTVPLLQLQGPLRPRFDITHSFLLGQAHLLISLGLALGSDRIALELIFLGGLLTAATLYAIARKLTARKLTASPLWPLFGVLVFLISPMVLWQTTTSGSPDIWMAFYLGISVLAASRALDATDSRLALLAGWFAGNAAGVKYTGWTVPIAVCAYLFLYFRPRAIAICSALVAFCGGCLPLLRNAVWTRDPFFPFASRWLNPGHVDSYALNFLLVDTRSSAFSRGLGHLLAFPLLLTIEGDRFGLGQYFGPIVLALAPLLLFLPWKSHLVRLAAAVWMLAFLANAGTAQMGRFLLPVFALALALIFPAIARAAELRWRAGVAAAAACLVVFVVFAAAADALYFAPALKADASSAQDFAISSFVNNTLRDAAKQQPNEKALVYYRHLYYLRIPFVNGDPDTSWIFDPAKCDQAAGLLSVLQQEHVRWVVMTEDYPHPLAAAFQQLEREGKLAPIAHANVESTAGTTRLNHQKLVVPVTIFELEDVSGRSEPPRTNEGSHL